jgi:hypothetical protein
MSADGVHAATGAPGVLVLDGEEYRLAPLEVGDLPEILNWLEVQPHRRARRRLEALGDQATDEYRMRVLEAADAEAEKIRNHPKGALQVFEREAESIDGATAEGLVYAIWLMLRKHQPEMPLGIARQLVTADNLTAITNAIGRAYALPGKARARSRKRARLPRGKK